LDRRCTAVHTCLCVFLYMWCQANLETGIQDPSKKTWRQEHTIYVLSDGALCFYLSPFNHYKLPSFTLLLWGITLCCIFCCLLQYYSILHASVCYLCLPHVLNDKGCKCKCKVGSCPKLSCCFLCFPERERRDIASECWKLLPWFLGTFCCTFLVVAMSISPN